MSNQAKCFEFIGLWGSGKTTLINKLSKELKKQGFKVVRFSDFDKQKSSKRYFEVIFFVIKNPLHTLKIFYYFIKIYFKLSPFDNLQIDIFKTLFKKHFIKNIFLEKNSDIILLEGAFHLLPIFSKMNKLSNREIIFSGSTKNYCESNYIISINIDKDLALKRIEKDKEMGFDRFKGSKPNNILHLLDLMSENENFIKKKFYSSKNNIFNIKGNDSLSNKTEYLLNFIKDNL